MDFETIDDAVSAYVSIRDELDRVRKEFKKHEADSKSHLQRIEMWILEKANELGMESIRTASGTAYKTTKKSYRVGIWNDFIEWIKATDNFQCLEKRAAKLAVMDVHKDTGEIPPGLDYIEEITIDVRRPTK